MATKYPQIWHGMYIGNMTEDRAQLIMQAREQKIIPNLQHMIFDFPPELVLRSLNEHKSIRSIIKEENINYEQYIGSLRDYQTVGVAFMYISPRSINADSCGLGKTAEISGLINWLKQRNEMTRFLVAVETSALGQVQAELIRFTGLNIVALPSESPKLKKAINSTDWNNTDGIVIKHSTLRSDTFSKWIAQWMNQDGTCRLFDTFFLDESSVIKNADTKIYNYTKNICDISKRVHFMNATTFETNIIDIYNQLDIMNNILLPKKWRIEKEFCTYNRESYWTKVNGKAQINFTYKRSGYKNQEIFKNLLKLVYFGRSKKDVGKDLPHIYKVYEVDPTPEMSTLLKKKMFRYNELLNCPSLVPDSNIPFDRKHVPKLDRLCELVENDFMDSSIMIYCFHLEAQQVIANEMAKIGKRPVVLNGSCSDDERFEAQDKFNKGECDVIITNIKKSLNLYGGDTLIFYSMETNIAKMEQIRGRIDRNVDDRLRTFVMLLYNGTAEYKFFNSVVLQRAKDARSLTIDAKTAADYFFESIIDESSRKGE